MTLDPTFPVAPVTITRIGGPFPPGRGTDQAPSSYDRAVARISFPEAGFGEHVDWALQRPEMAGGMGKLSEAVYGHSRLPVREREAARYVIALVNHCAVCQDTRAERGPQEGIDDGFYAEVANWRASEALTDRERLAAEFAERFALDHQTMDDEFFDRMRTGFADDELADLVICCGMFLGMGRAMAVVGVPAPEERILV